MVMNFIKTCTITPSLSYTYIKSLSFSHTTIYKDIRYHSVQAVSIHHTRCGTMWNHLWFVCDLQWKDTDKRNGWRSIERFLIPVAWQISSKFSDCSRKWFASFLSWLRLAAPLIVLWSGRQDREWASASLMLQYETTKESPDQLLGENTSNCVTNGIKFGTILYQEKHFQRRVLSPS